MNKILVIVLSMLCSLPCLAAENNFGLGFILGAPTGLSANYKVSEARTIDMALAYDFSDDFVHLHSTYLFHQPESLNFDEMDLGWYSGIGARILFDDGRRDEELRVGLRGALGLSLELDRAPIEIFAELAPVLNLIENTDLDLDGGIGLRYYF
jgi:hypothetical protein